MCQIIHVLLVEDDEMLSAGLEMIINNEADMCVSATARNGLQALEKLQENRPDLVLLDLEMPVMNGIDCIREIRRRDPDLPVLILSSFSEDAYIYEGIAYGANGYLLKGTDFEKLGQTIRDVLHARFVLDAEIGRRVAQFVLTRSDQTKQQSISRYFQHTKQFTEQEQAIIRLLLDRLPNKDIAEQLHFSKGTIKNKLTVIYEKIGVSSREEAIDYFQTKALP